MSKATKQAEIRKAQMLRLFGDPRRPVLEMELEKQRGIFQRTKMSPVAERLMAQSIFSRAKALGQDPGVKLPIASDYWVGGHRTETKEVR